jgi:hypothetical protein
MRNFKIKLFQLAAWNIPNTSFEEDSPAPFFEHSSL